MARNTTDQLRHSHDGYVEKKYDVAPRVIKARANINPKRIKRATRSLYDFICTYGVGSICEYAPPPEMREVLDDMERCAASSSGRYQIQMSRGFGKTTFVSGLALYRLVKGLSHFVEVIAATDGKATDIFDTIISIFTSDTFAEDYPEVGIPLRESGGNSIRMQRQNWNGKMLNMEKKAGRFILPTVPDSALSAAKIVIKSFTAKDLRGLNIHHERPDFIILDDIQTDEMAANPEQIRKAVKKINGTIRGQFAHHKQGTMLMTATPIFPGDVSELIKEDPGWITKVYPMMKAMPTNTKLWDQYGDVLHAEIAATAVNAQPKMTANSFYRAHRKELDAGAEPLSPHVFVRVKELSAIQHAMNVIYGSTDGLEVFETEYQMHPQRSQTVYDLDYKTVLKSANGVPHLTIPNPCTRLFAAIDVMKNAGLRYTVTAFGADRVSAVVTYGRYPPDNRPLFNQADMLPVKQSKVANALDELVGDLQRMVFVSADGSRRYRIGAIAVDAGWMYRTVITFCGSHAGCFATRGIPFTIFSPRTKSGELVSGVIDATDWCYERQIEFGSFIGFHSDYWRETAQRAWLNAPLQPSSLSVYGESSEHLQFAQECVADQLVEKDKTRSGAETWRWAVNGPNHLGDCVTMCYALAHWRRCYSVGGDIGQECVSAARAVTGQVPRRPVKPRPRTVCL